MIRLLLPIILLGLSGVIFFSFIDPLINASLIPAQAATEPIDGGVVALRQEKAKLEQALEHAKELSKRIEELTTEYNNLPQEKLARLDQLLPDTVDNVQLIIDINNIAKSHGMEIRDVKVKTEEERTQTPVISRSGSMEKGAVALTFSVVGPYDVFQKFLVDLARSLRVVDIISATVSSDKPNIYQYTIEVKTYWLK